MKDFVTLLTKPDFSAIIEQEFKIGGESMAQVLKDEIRENILKAALQEFYEKGYKSAAMREIASKAKIPTGLIYS